MLTAHGNPSVSHYFVQSRCSQPFQKTAEMSVPGYTVVNEAPNITGILCGEWP